MLKAHALTALLVLASERSVLAQSALEPVSLVYRAPAACPSFEQFWAEIERSSSRLRLAHEGEAARRFEVVIEPSGTEGTLELEGGNGGERKVSGASCGAVADLLAFAVALAADPEAQPPGAPAVATFQSLPEAPPAPAPEKPVFAAAPAPTPVVVDARPSTPSPTAHARWQWSVAAVGSATGVSSPAVTWGGGGYAELGLNSVAWAPRLRLGGNYARKTLDVESLSGQVALTTVFASFEVCSGAPRRESLSFLPCLRAQGGSRDAAGLAPLPGRTEAVHGFFDLGFGGHLRWRFAGPAFIEAGAAVLFPIVRDQVKVLPSTVVYDVPAVGMLGELALGVEFGDQNPD